MLNTMWRFLVFLILFLAGPFLALAQASLSTTPPVTPPYDVNATLPGEGYQGFSGPYGGQKVLQYCYFNRFLGEPKAGQAMYLEFRACDAKKPRLDGKITWGDCSQQDISRITCGRWRVPHLYEKTGDYVAQIEIGGEKCASTTKPPDPKECEGEKPIDVVLTIDTTASMNDGGKLDAMKAALIKFIESLRPQDRASIVEFNTSQTRIILRLADYNKNKAVQIIEELGPAGHTSIGKGLSKGITAVKEARPDAFKAIVLASDGAENASPCARDFFNQIPADVTVYGVGTPDSNVLGAGPCQGHEPVLNKIVTYGTGDGEVIIIPFGRNQLVDVFAKIYDDIKQKAGNCNEPAPPAGPTDPTCPGAPFTPRPPEPVAPATQVSDKTPPSSIGSAFKACDQQPATCIFWPVNIGGRCQPSDAPKPSAGVCTYFQLECLKNVPGAQCSLLINGESIAQRACSDSSDIYTVPPRPQDDVRVRATLGSGSSYEAKCQYQSTPPTFMNEFQENNNISFTAEIGQVFSLMSQVSSFFRLEYLLPLILLAIVGVVVIVFLRRRA